MVRREITRRSPVHRGEPRVAARGFLPLGLLTALLVSCNVLPVVAPDDGAKEDAGKPDVFEKIRSIDLSPRFPNRVPAPEANGGKRVQTAEYPGGDPSLVVAPLPTQPTASGDGFDLNFENTPVSSVAKVVLGDILGVGYISIRASKARSACVRPAGAEVGHHIRARERVAAERRCLDPRQRGLPADATGRGGRRRRADTASNVQPGFGVSVVRCNMSRRRR